MAEQNLKIVTPLTLLDLLTVRKQTLTQLFRTVRRIACPLRSATLLMWTVIGTQNVQNAQMDLTSKTRSE